MLINIRERRLADAKLKKLTQRVFDAQEEERGRVARELHDGISQILVGRALCAGHHAPPTGNGAMRPMPKPLTRVSKALPAPFRRCAALAAICAPACWMILALGPA